MCPMQHAAVGGGWGRSVFAASACSGNRARGRDVAARFDQSSDVHTFGGFVPGAFASAACQTHIFCAGALCGSHRSRDWDCAVASTKFTASAVGGDVATRGQSPSAGAKLLFPSATSRAAAAAATAVVRIPHAVAAAISVAGAISAAASAGDKRFQLAWLADRAVPFRALAATAWPLGFCWRWRQAEEYSQRPPCDLAAQQRRRCGCGPRRVAASCARFGVLEPCDVAQQIPVGGFARAGPGAALWLFEPACAELQHLAAFEPPGLFQPEHERRRCSGGWRHLGKLHSAAIDA
mmetsp:Transcript_114929/g.324823  ORF Transcript_114929/g.324823 Transcript_114929/m.324823 type:complete len:293 (-) Transcript_114929:379-1257(-)